MGNVLRDSPVAKRNAHCRRLLCFTTWAGGRLATILSFIFLLVAPVLAEPAPQVAQAGGIKAQDPETAGRGEGTTGWVQAPVARGQNAPQQTSQGKGASAIGTHPNADAQQPSSGQNPGTPIATPLPGPGGADTSHDTK